MKQEKLTLTEARLATPLGTLLILIDHQAVIRAVDWETHTARLNSLLNRHYRQQGFDRQQGELPHHISHAITRYFESDLNALTPLSVATNGTAFQQTVWQALRTIPPGQTRSYGELADSLGYPNAARAVGAANGANPINLLIPCHRVIGAHQHLTGYAGGLERKRWLLRHEQALMNHQPIPANHDTTQNDQNPAILTGRLTESPSY